MTEMRRRWRIIKTMSLSLCQCTGYVRVYVFTCIENQCRYVLMHFLCLFTSLSIYYLLLYLSTLYLPIYLSDWDGSASSGVQAPYHRFSPVAKHHHVRYLRSDILFWQILQYPIIDPARRERGRGEKCKRSVNPLLIPGDP